MSEKENNIVIFYDVNGVFLIGEEVEQRETEIVFKNLCRFHEDDDDPAQFYIYGDIFFGMSEGGLAAMKVSNILFYAKAHPLVAARYLEQISEIQKNSEKVMKKQELRDKLTVLHNNKNDLDDKSDE